MAGVLWVDVDPRNEDDEPAPLAVVRDEDACLYLRTDLPSDRPWMKLDGSDDTYDWGSLPQPLQVGRPWPSPPS